MISVVIPTHNRAALLEVSLRSLAGQSLPRDRFEVVVVDDGSTDSTREVCTRLSAELDLKYNFLKNSGIAAAKNLGIFVAKHPILLFFDDDDVAHRHLLQEHLESHRRNPEPNFAVLGYTRWAPWLRVTEVMHYVTEVGGYLFSYGNLKHGQVLDFTYFWGGRSSCKQQFLTRHGIFHQGFRFGSEDIELGYRLSKHGLRMVHNRCALQYMNRPITFDDFCFRCERQGTSQYHFSELYRMDPVVQAYCQTDDAAKQWESISPLLPAKLNKVKEMESMFFESHLVFQPSDLLKELHHLYGWIFTAYKKRGIAEASQSQISR